MKILNTEEFKRFICDHGDTYIILTSLGVISLAQLEEREKNNKEVYKIIKDAKNEYERIKNDIKQTARPFGLP